MSRNNKQLLESLDRFLENDSNKLEAILRKLLSDEQEATASYMKASHKVKEYAEEHSDAKALKIVKVLDDIANEERVHIGELNKLMKLIGVSTEQEKEGEQEAQEKL